MGNKIKMSEVNNFNASLQKSLSSLSTNTKTLKNNINKLKDDSEFKGKQHRILIAIIKVFILKQ